MVFVWLQGVCVGVGWECEPKVSRKWAKSELEAEGFEVAHEF